MPFWRLFHTFSISFSRPILKMVLFQMFFIFQIFSFWTNPGRHAFYSVKHIVSVQSPFSKKTFFYKLTFRQIWNDHFIFALIFHQFSWLFRHRFSHRFFLGLFMKMAPKMNDPVVPGPPKKTILFKTFSVISILCRCWLTLGSFLAHFGSLLANCWCPLALFWRPWAHFLVPLGSLLVTLALDFLTFGAF